jgi:16S rRNA G1207 methylase RsmC
MTEHYYTEKPTSPLREENIFVYLPDKKYSFVTASGLFSRDHLDIATKLLIEKCDLSNAKKILDLGSGWGVVAVVLKHRNPNLIVCATDINERAVRYTKKNAEKNRLSLVTKKSDVLKNWEEEMFDVILTNPPYAAGRKICYSFIEESFNHLNKNGSLQLVARHQKGGKMLSIHMEEIFGNVSTLSIKSGFRIYKSVKN